MFPSVESLKYQFIRYGERKFIVSNLKSWYAKIMGTSAPIARPAIHISAMPPGAIAKKAVINENPYTPDKNIAIATLTPIITALVKTRCGIVEPRAISRSFSSCVPM